MRKYILLLIFAAIIPLTSLHAQRVTLTLPKMTLRAALPYVEKAAGVHFFYSGNLDGLNKTVQLNVKNASLDRCLNQLLKGTGIGYTLEANNVVALHAAKATPSPRTAFRPGGKTEGGLFFSGESSGGLVTGVVTDTQGEPLTGATVKVKGTGAGVATDLDGNFRLDGVSHGQLIEVSYVGFETVEVRYAGKPLNIRLKENTELLKEVVVVGYGTQKKVNLTGAVSVVDSKQLTGRPSINSATALQGADPSLNIKMGTGGPNSTYSIDIRGVASINGGSPLILVDGVEMNLSRLNANDIESVSILKDASAAAIYGAKASSGVVLITTKSGAADAKPTVTFDLKTGWKAPTTSTDFITQGYWSVFINDLFLNEHAGFGFTTYDESDYAELWMRLGQHAETAERPWAVVQGDGSYKYYANFDWYNHYFKRNRPMNDYNVSVKGGSERVSYFVSGRFYDEDGMIRQNNDKFQSYSTRAKMNIKVTDWLKYGVNMSFFNSRYTYPGGNDLQYTFRGTALHSLAYIPSTNPDGTSVYLNRYNYNGNVAVGNGLNAVLNYGKHFNNELNREWVVKNDVELRLLKDWTVNADHSYLFRNYEFEARRVPVPYSATAGVVSYIDPANASVTRDQYSQRHTRTTNQIYNIYTTYSPTFGEHHLKLMLGLNGESYRSRSLKAERYELLSTELSSFNIATGEIPTLIEDRYNSETRGYFGRLNYDYAGRYLFEASGRYDGSSRFHRDHRWGFFPSASLGWRISEEPFFKPLRRFWDNAKLRLSVGSLGNQQVSYYAYIQSIDTARKNSGVTLDGITQLDYASESDPVADNLTWEKVITYNAGLDLSFFGSRLNTTFDIYTRYTRDMLTNGASLPAVYGAAVPKMNAADMRTRGWELSVSWNDKVALFGRPLSYTVGAGIGDYRSKITKFDNPTKRLSDYYEGMTLGQIWGYHVSGLFATDEEAAAWPIDQTIVNQDIQVSGPHKGLHAGDMRYEDLDGDGVIGIGENTADNPGDRRVIGNSLPRYNYNFRLALEYRGFDLSAFFQGVGRCNWYPATEATTFWGPYSRPYQAFIHKDFMNDVWSEDNPDAYFPRYRGYEALGSGNQLGPVNDRYLQNLAYLRLKNLTVGYTLPLLKRWVSQIRVYFSGENLFYLSPFTKHCKTIDPEVAISTSTGINYGFSKSFTFGLNVEI